MNHCQFIKEDDEINFVYRHDEFRIVIRSISQAFESIIARFTIDEAKRCFHAKSEIKIANKLVDMQYSTSVETTVCTPGTHALLLQFEDQLKVITLSESEWASVLEYMRAENIA